MGIQVVDDWSEVWYCRRDKRVVDLCLRQSDVHGFDVAKVVQAGVLEGVQSEGDYDDDGQPEAEDEDDDEFVGEWCL